MGNWALAFPIRSAASKIGVDADGRCPGSRGCAPRGEPQPHTRSVRELTSELGLAKNEAPEATTIRVAGVPSPPGSRVLPGALRGTKNDKATWKHEVGGITTLVSVLGQALTDLTQDLWGRTYSNRVPLQISEVLH